MTVSDAIEQLHSMAVNEYPDDVAAVRIVQAEIERLQAKVRSCEDQLVAIADYLGGDARDVVGDDKTIAGLVKERIERLQAEVQQLRTSDVFGNDELLD